MFEDLENKSPLVQLLAVAGFIAILLFIAGLFLGFLLGIAGRIPGYGGRVKYKGPGDWIEFYKNEIIEPLRESKTRRWYSAFEAKWIVEEPSPLERSLLIFILILLSPLFFGTLLGGCVGTLVPPAIAMGIVVVLAGFILLAEYLGYKKEYKIFYVVKEGQFHIGVGGTLSAAALIIVFTI